MPVESQDFVTRGELMKGYSFRVSKTKIKMNSSSTSTCGHGTYQDLLQGAGLLLILRFPLLQGSWKNSKMIYMKERRVEVGQGSRV